MKKLVIFSFTALLFSLSAGAQIKKIQAKKTMKAKTLSSISTKKLKENVKKLKIEAKKEGE